MKTFILLILFSQALLAQNLVIHDNASSIEILPDKISSHTKSHPSNTKNGYQALGQIKENYFHHTAVGAFALSKFKVGSGNSAIGYSALAESDSVSYNTAVGSHALEYNLRGEQNTAIGSYALTQNKMGFLNTALGYYALGNSLTANRNIGIGDYPLMNNETSNENIAIGSNALYNHQSGDFNIALGNFSLRQNYSGSKNIALGQNTMELAYSGSNNIAIGEYALMNNQTDQNIAIGSNSLLNNSQGINNVGIGILSLAANESGSFNTAIGVQSSNNTTSSYNTSLGYRSLYYHNDNQGGSNTGIGAGALGNMTSGQYNIALGRDALYYTSSGSRNVIIGADVKGETNMDYKLIIENSGVPIDSEKPLIGGNFSKGFEAEVNNRRVGIDRSFNELMARDERFQVEGEAFKTSGSGNWVIPSDRRLKTEIINLNSEEMLDKIISMQGVSYKWIDPKKGQNLQIGFIAQDLQKVFPEKVKEDKNGYLSAAYGDFDPVIVEAIKALVSQNQKLKERLQKLELIISKSSSDAISAQN